MTSIATLNLESLKAQIVALRRAQFGAKSERLAGQGEINLGTRTVLEYLLSPVRKAWQEAGRER